MKAVLALCLITLSTLAGSATPHSGNGDAGRVPGGTTILVVGDSISAGLGIQREEGWVHLLSQKLAAIDDSYRVVNASISGDTTQAGVVRLPRALETHHPDIVILELGGNDGLRGYPIDRIKHNLLAMTEAAKTGGARVVIVGMQIPPNYGPRYTAEFREMFVEVTRLTNSAFVPFLLEGVATDESLMQQDGIHPTALAQPILLDNIWPVLRPLIAPSQG